MTEGRSGQIISFYSYKGGVGRSMALANVAVLLCRSGKSVLAVDWDLEAPGLHKFFEQVSPDLAAQVASRFGILDMIGQLKEGSKFEWREGAIDVGLRNSRLYFISSGRHDPSYSSRLQGLRWDRLYDECDIGQAFENMREEWKQAYDYVLLDSRTGVTDIGDVCTALLPDLLVTVFVANEQNIEGTKLIVERARAVHSQLPRDRTKLIVVPLLGRDESYAEKKLSDTWRKRVTNELGFTLSDWLPKEVDAATYFQKVYIPYYSYWSYGENIPVVQQQDEISNPASISAAYGRLTSLLDSGLDWRVLEKGVDAAELNSLRSRAAESEEKIAELEATREEMETHKVRQSEAVGKSRRQVLIASLVGAAAVVLAVTATAAYIGARDRESTRAAIAATQTQLTEERASLEATARQLDEQRTNLTKQVSDLRKQNAELLAQLQSQNDLTQQLTTLQKQNKVLLETVATQNSALQTQNAATQRKLDEIIRQNSGNATDAQSGKTQPK